MNPVIKNSSFHHIEVPCDDLELAERFYVIVFGAKVYMRRDAARRSDVPTAGTISEAEDLGFEIDGTYMRIGDTFRIGFLKREHNHAQREIDHIAFTIEDDNLQALGRRLTEYKVEVIEQAADHMSIRDPFGLMLELWPRTVLQRMRLL